MADSLISRARGGSSTECGGTSSAGGGWSRIRVGDAVGEGFDAGQLCEVRWEIDVAHGHEGQLNVQTVSKDEADLLQIGEVYGLHLRRL